MIRPIIRFKFYEALFALAVLAPWWTSNARAACTGSHPTWTSTPDSTSVTNCVNSASSGDTINVTAGSATWPGNISIASKSLKIIGAGSGSTVISSNAFTLTDSASRITGFTFNFGSGAGSLIIEYSIGFRIDHNIFTRSTWDTAILAYGSTGGAGASRPVEGLIDNNTIHYGRIVYYGEPYAGQSTGQGSNRWAEPLNLGTSNALYVEDNHIENPDGTTGGSYGNGIDGNLGSRYVVRFNTFLGSRIEQHSLQGDNERGVRLWEFYNNSMTNPAMPNYRPYFIRGGTGVIFHNTSDGTFVVNQIHLDNARSEEDSIASQIPLYKFCDGTSFPDGNTGAVGYPCRDQIGRSTDASYWNHLSPAPAQAFAPAYIWRNTQPGGETPVALSCESANQHCNNQTLQIVESRDYYSYRSSFNGTAGVGEGTLQNRPSSCATGVGYWATDQGKWNSKTSGPDGQLYKCTAPNTWSLYYIPYTYPHPLQAGSGGNQPAPPTNLRTIVH